MPSSWITALKLYNSQETNINVPHKSVWAIPRKNTKAMEEVRALMPRGAPGGAKIVHGQKSKPLPTELKPETLTKLRQVETETKARNAERKFAAKVKSIVDDIQGYIDIIEVGRTKTVGDKDKIVEARDAVLKRREQLADPKNKEIFEAMKDNKVMTYKIPDKVMKMKMSTEEEEEEQPEPEPEPKKKESIKIDEKPEPEAEPKKKVQESKPVENKFPFLKKMLKLPPNLADLLDIELTASQKSLLKAVEKVFDSRVMPEKIETESGEFAIRKEEMVKDVTGQMLSDNVAKKLKIVNKTGSNKIPPIDFYIDLNKEVSELDNDSKQRLIKEFKRLGKEELIPKKYK